MSLDSALIDCHARGRWSFAITVPVPSFPSTPPFRSGNLLYADIEPAYARPWTVSLCAMKFGAGTFINSRTPANQIDTAPGYFVTLTWGVDGMNETATVDYPFAGGTFMVQASSLQVQIGTQNPVSFPQTPTLSGFLAPCVSAQTTVNSPTFTPAGFVGLAQGGGLQVYEVPPRATSFRLIDGFGFAIGLNSIQVKQVDSNLNPVDYVVNYPTQAVYPGAVDNTQQNKSGYYPLSPRCSLLTLTNTNVGGGSIFIGPQWQLDLG